MNPPLVRLHASLWECDAPLSVLGMHLGHRMVVVRLPDGGLLVHSPVEATAETTAAVDALGPVRWIVAPSLIHDLYVPGWFAKYPDAVLAGPPGMAAKFPQWPWRAELGEALGAAWRPDLEVLVIAGAPRVNETVFFHRPSRSLIVADLVFNVGHAGGLVSRTLFRLNGCCGQVATSRLFRSVVKDRAALRGSLDRMFEWDFTRVIVGHGKNLETDAKETVRAALRWAG